MRRAEAGQTLTELILEVFRLNGRLLSAGDALTRPAGQTSARWQVLGALEEQGRTVADIGRRMGLTRQSVQRTADLLEVDGLVSYANNPAHRRAKLATLTSHGREVLDAITIGQIKWANALASRLVEKDVRHALRTLRVMRKALDDAAVAADRRTSRPPSAGARVRRSGNARRRSGS